VTTPSFATLVRAHRREARMTLHSLAAASGVSVRAIGDMERGRSASPQRRTLDALADALSLTPAQRATLATAAEAAARAARSAPHAPPRDVADFTGRAAELAFLATTPGTVVIHGMPGVGKTALAVHAASAYGGEVHFVDCRTTVSKRRPPGLLILDNADSPSQVQTALGLPAAPSLQAARGPGPVWVTSRGPLTGLSGVTRLALAPFTPAESAALLAPGGHEVNGASAVAAFCGHLPLAVRIAGNRLAGRPGWTMSHLADRLADENRRLTLLTAGDLSVDRTLASAYTRLSEPARDLCRKLAADPTAIERPDPALAELIEHGVVDDRGRMHSLMRLYASTTDR
jgi:transcriptional regulator with XRE-family HTH domain